ncbi:hypothetical protein ASE01_23455 [Nocardioides sp. Root190]|uniref:GrpB family protein n=1 Tax=Nocardioides sp. Root190 TaxID=1736488 RepID=UPI000700CB3C|nr:GrpB family protein [Nocardioides sp. Root190]KRB79270.1 hypothetical protein ASE01_23455 [Nocardioides sp. Root190]
MRVTVLPYDPQWPRTFESIRTHLAHALDASAVPHLAIEHVGSTSVPGLAAKPVLDVDVVVQREHLGDAIAALVSAGYTHEGDKGVPDRHFLRHSPDDDLAEATRHVYVCVDGALSLRNHLAVRDTLRGDAQLRDAYAAVKLDLATQELDGIEDYIEGKNDVLQRILAAAGISPDDLGQILAVNQKPA